MHRDQNECAEVMIDIVAMTESEGAFGKEVKRKGQEDCDRDSAIQSGEMQFPLAISSYHRDSSHLIILRGCIQSTAGYQYNVRYSL